MRHECYPARLLIPTLVVLTFVARTLIHADANAEDSKRQDVDVIRGKAFDAWIAQAKNGSTLEDRQNALQVLRNDGLEYDRDRTIRAFADALSDEAPSVRSLAAAGLMKAGSPTDPEAVERLVEILSKDLSGAKPPERNSEKASGDSSESEFPIREIRALGVIGEEDHIPVLRRIAENEDVHALLRQFAERSARQIEKRRDRSQSER